MPNRLAQETSPYLLQHAGNPVDWYPWNEEALQRARAEDKPVFLSIGYSACHWCHVMEHESFEDETIAAVLNANFVCIKVDREERPELDQIYMAAVQLLTGRGGWPMSVFLTPEMKPFFGGTYWPPEPRHGMPGFGQVLAAVIDAWQNRNEQARAQSDELTRRIQQIGLAEKQDEFALAHANLLVDAAADLEKSFDFSHGGFGGAPKFPHAMCLQHLLRIWHRSRRDGVLEMVQLTLDKMAAGGIYDHLGGGFCRYAVDQQWLVPHFEKMLYDNGLLAAAYLDGFLASGAERYAQTAREILDYVLDHLTDPQGGFHSSEDADSEGEEGKFYVWTPAEVRDHLGEEAAARFCYVYDVTPEGNFEGKSILNLPKSIEQCAAAKGWDLDELREELAASRATLRAVRNDRVRPGKDDKVLVNWNGLMIDAMARGGRILQDERYLDAATVAARFILQSMRRTDGRLLHSWRDGRARFDACLDDYACFANALVTLYETSFDEEWIEYAMELTQIIRTRFKDVDGRAFFYTADDHESLIARQKDVHDNSLPSGNSMTATLLTRLGKLCGRADFLADARGILDFAAEVMEHAPSAAGQMLIALDMQIGPFPEIVLLGDMADDQTEAAINDFWQRFIPNRVIACRPQPEYEGTHFLDAIFLGRIPLYGHPSVFICQKFACEAPVSGKEAAIGKWGDLVALGQQMPK